MIRRDFSARVAIMERRRILAPLCLLLLVGVVAGEKGKELQEKLQEAEEAQEFREEAFGPVVSDIISQAPPAELANGDGDVATTGTDRRSSYIAVMVAPQLTATYRYLQAIAGVILTTSVWISCLGRAVLATA